MYLFNLLPQIPLLSRLTVVPDLLLLFQFLSLCGYVFLKNPLTPISDALGDYDYR